MHYCIIHKEAICVVSEDNKYVYRLFTVCTVLPSGELQRVWLSNFDSTEIT